MTHQVARFNPSAKHPERAAQAWVILVGAAMNRQTLTYMGLSKLMYRRSAAGVLDRVLGHIAFYCKERELPVLTSIVVGKTRGTPGDDIPLDWVDLNKEREHVYAEDWFDIRCPQPEELLAAFNRAMRANKMDDA
jgi:hypothetical protein